MTSPSSRPPLYRGGTSGNNSNNNNNGARRDSSSFSERNPAPFQQRAESFRTSSGGGGAPLPFSERRNRSRDYGRTSSGEGGGYARGGTRERSLDRNDRRPPPRREDEGYDYYRHDGDPPPREHRPMRARDEGDADYPPPAAGSSSFSSRRGPPGGGRDGRRDDRDDRDKFPPPPSRGRDDNNYNDRDRDREGGPLDEDIFAFRTFAQWKRSIRLSPMEAMPDERTLTAEYATMMVGWKQRRDDIFCERHATEPWFLERYDPIGALANWNERREGVRRRAADPNLADMWAPLVCPSDAKLGAEGGETETPLVPARDLPPPFSEGPTLYIPVVPAAIPRAALENVPVIKSLVEAGKAMIFLGDVNRSTKRRDLSRRGLIIFSDANEVEEMMKRNSLNVVYNSDPDGAPSPFSSDAQSPPTSSGDGAERRNEAKITIMRGRRFGNRLAPANMTEPRRVALDLRMAHSLARALDNANDVVSQDPPQAGVDFMLATRFRLPEEDVYGYSDRSDTENAYKLDFILNYLRRVHLVCYYSGVRCRDLGELIIKCSCPYLRRRPGEGPTDSKFAETVDSAMSGLMREADTWAAHEQRLQERARKQSEWTESLVSQRKVFSRAVDEQEDGVHCCTRGCGKVFAGFEFAAKHVVKVHPPVARAGLRRLLFPLMRDEFCEDHDRPVPRLPKFVEDIIASGMSSSSSSSGGGKSGNNSNSSASSGGGTSQTTQVGRGGGDSAPPPKRVNLGSKPSDTSASTTPTSDKQASSPAPRSTSTPPTTSAAPQHQEETTRHDLSVPPPPLPAPVGAFSIPPPELPKVLFRAPVSYDDL